ncbi:polysaccharide lyase beta-sandwich domain-containing protein [Mycobacterium sp. Aquia_216]|uniref:polysaccharide lyase beta-sandwich domain-containing protein n=1 Tax=Mycobacterium sp. Aquia_216 TaxID=2991729 RepID=UPI003FA3A9AD
MAHDNAASELALDSRTAATDGVESVAGQDGSTTLRGDVGSDDQAEDLTALESQAGDDADDAGAETTPKPRRWLRFWRGRDWGAIFVRGVLPALALVLALGAAWLKWQVFNAAEANTARVQAVQAATEGTVAILSYQPGTVEHDLAAARDRLTGQFRDSYTSLTHDVVVPGAKEKKVAAVATAPAAATMSASPGHAVVLVFVNQTTIVDNGAPTSTVSSVQVTLDKINGRWLISGFDPV